MVKFDKAAKEDPKQVPRFSYKGVFVEYLEPVTDIKDIDQLIFETNDRLAAMYEFCMENGLMMTSFHMRAALGVLQSNYNSMRKGSTKRINKDGVDRTKDLANCIATWEDRARMAATDITKRDSIPARSIYLMKSQYQQWDTPQETNDKSAVSVELILNRKDEILAVEKKRKLVEAAAARKSKKE